MNFLYPKLYGVLCYCTNMLLILSPIIFNYIRTSQELWIPIVAGVIACMYTSFTNAEFGLVKTIKFSNLLLLDLLTGSFLIISPKIFHYERYVYQLPYLWIGLIKIFTALAAGNSLHSSHLEQRRERLSNFNKLIQRIKITSYSLQHSFSKWTKASEQKSMA